MHKRVNSEYVVQKQSEAEAHFTDGYNCCQAVCITFAAEFGIDESTILSLSTSFGGGFGRQRLVCGSVSGATMLMGILYPEIKNNAETKKHNYAKVQEFCEHFKEEAGSIICSELLNIQKGTYNDPQPSPRTELYYKKRPCKQLVGLSARILAEMTENKKTNEDSNH